MSHLTVGPDTSGLVIEIAGDRLVDARGTFEKSKGVHLPADGACIAPGDVNAHTHLYSGLAPLGLPAPSPPPRNFLEILERVWWRLDRALDAESLRASARYYVAEALLAGTTTLIDHHESPGFIEGSLDVLADACQELGMRAILGYGATERNGGREEAKRGLAECARFAWDNPRPLVESVVALHASFTVSDDTMREAGELCREIGTVLHLHVAEDVADMEDARKRGYKDPVDRLLHQRALPEGSILAHGVHLDAEAVRRADQRGVWFVQNPRSNRGNRVGYPRALAESQRVALGTDGYPSVLSAEVAGADEPPAVLEKRRQAGGRLASERFGMALGVLEPDAAADLVVVGDAGVRHVVVNGVVVVRDGRLLTGDLEAIRAEARAAAPRLWDRMASH